MKVNQLLSNVVIAIQDRLIAEGKTWCIVWRDEKIQCVPRRTVVESVTGEKIQGAPFDFKFGTITESDIREGLTGKQWNTIHDKIFTFLKARGMLS